MNSHWDSLTSLLPPPAVPKGLDRSWDSVEAELGLSLPTDFKKFIDTYGTGLICGKGMDFGYLGIWNYRESSRPSLMESVSSVIKEYEDARKNGYQSPYSFYPERGGLLPFANTPTGDYFNWTTSGAWEVVFYDFKRAEMVLLQGHEFFRVVLELLKGTSPLFPDRIGPTCLTAPFKFTDVNW